MTGHDHYRALGVANHMLGHASEEEANESRASVRGDHHEIGIGLPRLAEDFVYRIAGPNNRCSELVLRSSVGVFMGFHLSLLSLGSAEPAWRAEACDGRR